MNKTSSISQRLSRVSGWDFYSYFIFGVIVLFQVGSWSRFPLFIDCYYHLSVMMGFNDAGGWVGTAFWEYAPFGRPHLYPPFFHILGLSVYKLGLGLIGVARLFDVLIYPAVLFSVWYVIRRLFSSLLAFFSLFLIFSSYPLYLSVISNIPFSLAFIFGMFSFYFFEKKKLLSAFLSLALAFYSHSLLPWLFVLALFFYVFFDRKGIGFFLRVTSLSVAAALPLFYHQIKFISFVQFVKVPDCNFVELNPLLWVLALPGIWVALKKKGRYLFMVALALSFLILIASYRHRLFSGLGLVSVCFFGAVVLEEVFNKVSQRAGRFRKVMFWCVAVLVFHFFSIWILSSPFIKGHNIIRGNSPLANWLGVGNNYYVLQDISVYYPETIQEVVDLIEANSKEDDIIFSNYNYAGGMLALFAHRATSTGMLGEVRPFSSLDAAAHARLILWFKEPDGGFPAELSPLIDKYGLKKLGETELVYIYLNDRSQVKRQIMPARVPYWLCLFCVLMACSIVVFEARAKIKVDIS